MNMKQAVFGNLRLQARDEVLLKSYPFFLIIQKLLETIDKEGLSTVDEWDKALQQLRPFGPILKLLVLRSRN